MENSNLRLGYIRSSEVSSRYWLEVQFGSKQELI